MPGFFDLRRLICQSDFATRVPRAPSAMLKYLSAMGTLPNGINIARTNIEFGGAGDELCCVVAIDPCAVCPRQAGKINSINRLPKRHLGILGVPKNQTACKSSGDIHPCLEYASRCMHMAPQVASRLRTAENFCFYLSHRWPCDGIAIIAFRREGC